MADKNEILEQVKQVKALTEDLLEYQSLDTAVAYRRVENRVRRQSRKQLFLGALSRIAVVLLLPLLVSSLVLSYLYVGGRSGANRTQAVLAWHEVHSAPGTVTRLELPDRSVVWLNARSTLVYPAVFTGREREVRLSGEGYFEVESDPQHPFYVTTSEGVKVKAYGTKFNVNAYADEPTVDAVLERGHVDVIARNRQARLEPGQGAAFDKNTGRMAVDAVSLEETTGWKDGKLVFRNTPLEVVLKKLSRRYNVDIVLHQKGNKEYKYRATFTTETVEQILDYLKLTAPIRWSYRRPEQNQDASFTPPRMDVYVK